MRVFIGDDFDLRKIAESGQVFRVRQNGDTYCFIAKDHALQIRSIGNGSFDVDCAPDEWAQNWYVYFDLGRDYAAIRAQIPKQDSFLQRAAEEGRGIRILRQDPWEMLITFLLSQRKSIPAIKKNVEMLAQRYGIKINGTDFYGFPTTPALATATEQDLRALGLGYRAPYLCLATKHVENGMLDFNRLGKLDDAALIAALMKEKGVGVKVSGCVALFAYNRMGVAPIDVWMQRLIRAYYGGKNPFIDNYAKYAGLYQQYAFYYALRHKEEVRRMEEIKCGRS